MSEHVLTELLPAMEIAAFERDAAGTFTSMAPPPAWFKRIAADPTFPFLGHILEEANMFWQEARPGASEFGPCAEVDGTGAEFHYKVSAINAGDRRYLVFQLDPGTDRMRLVLQKVRNEALDGERHAASHEAVAASLRSTNQEIKGLLQKLVLSEVTPEQRELLNTLAARCVDQMGGIQKLILATIPHV